MGCVGLRANPDRRFDNFAPGKKSRNQKRNSPAIRLGTWNVRTMTPGLSEDLQQVSDARKTAVINNELSRLKMDIVTLQETRLSSSGSIREKDFTFFWQGKPPEETRQHGVGFAIRNGLLGSVVEPTEGTERLLKIQLHTAAGMVSLISAYAPTLTSSAEAKDKFYDDLDTLIREIPEQEPVFLLGDFNARVGADHSSWPTCLGQFGVGRMNENGQRLLEFCCHHDLCVTNTFYDAKPQHKVSWRHPRSKHWHQLDFVLTRRRDLGSVKLTRSFQSADCDTDHSLVCSKVKFQPRRIHRAKKEGKPRIDTTKTRDPDKVKEFIQSLERDLPGPPSATASDRWAHVRDTIYNAAMSTFGKRQAKSADWFEANTVELLPLVEEKRRAFSAYKNVPSERNLQALRTARSRVQQAARRCANDYWLQLCTSIQTAANVGNVRGMYEGIK